MAVDSPHNSHESVAKRKWDRYMEAKDLPQLKHAEHAKNFGDFGRIVQQFDKEIDQDTLWKYWQEVDPSKTPLPSQHSQGDHAGNSAHEQEHSKGDHDRHKSFTEKLEEGLVPGVSKLLRKPKFMEEDPEFWKLMEQEQKTWAKNNKKPGRRASKDEKTTYSENYTNFYYGNLDAEANTTEGKSLEERTKDKLRSQYESETYTDKKGNIKQKNDKQKKRDLEKLKRYEENEDELKKKITRKSGFFGRKQAPIKFDEDSDVWKTKQKISGEAGARYALLKQKGLKSDELDQSYKAIMKRLQEKHWKDFAEKFPEKAEHLAKEDYKTKTFKKRWWEKTNTRQEYEDQKRATFEAFRNGREQFLREQEAAHNQKEQSGIIDRGKVHRDKNALTAQQAADRLQALSGQTSAAQPTPQLIVPQNNKKPSTPPASNTTPSTTAQQASQQRINRLTAILHRFSQQQQQQQASPSGQQQKGIFSKTIDTANDVYNKYKSAKDFYNFGRSLFQGSQAATAAEGATVAAEGLAAAEGAAAAGSAAATGAAATGAAATGAAAGGTAAAAGATAAAGAGAAATGAAAAGGAGAGAAGGIIAGGWLVLLIILIIIILIFIIYILAQILGGSNTSTSQTIPGLTLRLEGPTQVANSENIQYTIYATYTGTADITLSDPLPSETTFVSATGNYQLSFSDGGKNTVSWKLNDNAPSGTGTKSYVFTLTIHPDKNDTIVKNKILATAAGMTGGTTLPPNPDAHDFETLMRGQGRNTGVLGDENSFVRRILASGERRLADKERELRQIYQASLSRNVNPLVVVSDWGLESGYDTTGRYAAMGCDPRGVLGIGRDFASQLSCATKTWDNLMKEYDEKAKNGVPVRLPSQIGKECLYDDSFLYAAERYGPTCVVYDGNDYFHRNFYKNYKMFLESN